MVLAPKETDSLSVTTSPPPPMFAPESTREPAPSTSEETSYESSYDYPDEPRRRIGLWLLLAVLALIAATTASWYFGVLNFDRWLGQASVEQALRIESIRKPERVTLESGNELLRVYGRITNVSKETRSVPQIHALLRDSTGRIVHTFPISAPVSELRPQESATFDAAETNVPRSAQDLELTFKPAS
jgi:hypothetical protein